MDLMQMLKLRFARVRRRLSTAPEPPADEDGSALQYWRDRILFAFLASGLALGALTIVPVAVYAFNQKKWMLLLLDLAVYGAGLYLFLSRRLSYGVRSAIALGVCYAVGVYVILLVGMFSGGPAWLFGFAVLAGCLRGFRPAVGALLLNAATLTILGFLGSAGVLPGSGYTFSRPELALTAGFNFMLLNTVSALSVAVLVRGLESTTLKEQAAVKTLTAERARIIRSREDLRREVSERIAAERALVRSESRYRALVETSPDIIFQIDFSGHLLFASPALGEILGFGAVPAKPLPVDQAAHPDDRATVAAAVEHLQKQGSVKNVECRVKTAGGGYVWLSTNATATLNEAGTERVVFAVAKEITEKKEAERQLLSSRIELERRVSERTRELREVNESLQRQMKERLMLQDRLIRSERLAATGQLAASIAHEINSPLQGVSALLNVMQKHRRDDLELQQDLQLVKGAFERIRDTVRNLLDLNRPGNERKQPMNLNLVVENTVALTRNFMARHHIDTVLDLDPKMPSVIGSPQQLGQVLINLVNNAVEAICGGAGAAPGAAVQPRPFGGVVKIRTRAGSDRVALEVSDNGPGIEEAERQIVFDPFYTRKKPMGMGVGLSICHGIVEDHGGTIQVQNGEDGGALFTVSLPQAGAPEKR